MNNASPTLMPFRENGKYGYKNSNSEVVISPKYKHAFKFKDGYAAVKLDYKWGYIDEKGTETFPGFLLKIPYGKMPLILYSEGDAMYHHTTYHRSELDVRAITQETDYGRPVCQDERHGKVLSHWNDQFVNLSFSEIIDYVNGICYRMSSRNGKDPHLKSVTLPSVNFGKSSSHKVFLLWFELLLQKMAPTRPAQFRMGDMDAIHALLKMTPEENAAARQQGISGSCAVSNTEHAVQIQIDIQKIDGKNCCKVIYDLDSSCFHGVARIILTQKGLDSVEATFSVDPNPLINKDEMEYLSDNVWKSWKQVFLQYQERLRKGDIKEED